MISDLFHIKDFTDLIDGTISLNRVKDAYCLVGSSITYGDTGPIVTKKFDLMGKPSKDESGRLHFTIIDYNERLHTDYLYIDYDYRSDQYWKKRKEKDGKTKVDKSIALVMNNTLKEPPALEEGSESSSVFDRYRNNETKKRRLTGGKKTRKSKK
jgi:hypothetical protein